MKNLIHNNYFFIFRLFLLLMIIIFLIFNLIFAIIKPEIKYESLSFGNRISCYYAYFTTQTNYLVVIYLLFHLFKLKIINSKLVFELRLAITVYITITCLVFWIGIFSISFNYEEIVKNFESGKAIDIYRWISTTILHLIIPMAMIINFLINSGENLISLKKQHHFWLWIIASYPIIYGIFIMFRGEVRKWDKCPLDTLYPYFFLNYNQYIGYYKIILLGSVFIIFLLLIFGLQYFYLKINNYKYNKNFKKRN